MLCDRLCSRSTDSWPKIREQISSASQSVSQSINQRVNQYFICQNEEKQT